MGNQEKSKLNSLAEEVALSIPSHYYPSIDDYCGELMITVNISILFTLHLMQFHVILQRDKRTKLKLAVFRWDWRHQVNIGKKIPLIHKDLIVLVRHQRNE